MDTEIRNAVERGIQKMNKFARKMDTNLLYYVASVLDPRIKSTGLCGDGQTVSSLLVEGTRVGSQCAFEGPAPRPFLMAYDRLQRVYGHADLR